ncbi:MAG: alkaline phosphatase family protein [Armatimonadaceae bacterium]
MKHPRLLLAVSVLLIAAGSGIAWIAPRLSERPIGEQSDGTVLVSSHQTLTPLGKIQRLSGTRPKAVAISPGGTIAVLAQGRVSLYTADGAELPPITGINAGPLGLAWSFDGSTLYAAQASGKIARILREPDGQTFRRGDDIVVDTVGAPGEPDVAAGTQGRGRQTGDPQVTGLAVSRDGRRLFVGMGIRNAVAVLDTASGRALRIVPVGAVPYHLSISPDGETVAVSCRGGKIADSDEPGALSAGTRVRIDPKTDAANGGGMAFIHAATYETKLVEAGRQPGGMAFSADSKRLYVASTDDDTLLYFDVSERKLQKGVTVRPAADPGFGQIPTDVAVSGDGKTLFVSCGGSNAVAVVDEPSGRIQGHLPTGWYPIALAERAGTLVVASSKGLGSRVMRDGAVPASNVHGTVGLMQFIRSSDRNDLAKLSAQVAQNNRWGRDEKPARRGIAPVPVPERVGEPSVFKHVVYIIKENMTYDNVFGDVKKGNGAPELCIFPEEVTPNHHKLAEEFVLLDNTYTSGTNSADGHQWTVSGIGNAYIEQNYGAHARSYPYDGGDPLAYSPKGFLWTAALAQGKTVRVYGEFVNKPSIKHRTTGKSGSFFDLWADYQKGMPSYEITSDTDNAALKPHLHPNYIGFPSVVPDQWRADQFIADIDRFEQEGKMPDLSILLLPNDHTMGTGANVPTPRATVADNDLALGRIVERLSQSRFWKETLILVIEDDSQYGVDHVDGHRTVALCISPYTRRNTVIREQYNHPSFIRTIGLVLGFPAMNRFDRTATPMAACFTPTPDFRPYSHAPARIPLDERNPAKASLRGEARRLAEACEKLDWDDVDRADAETVTRAMWLSQYPNRPFPAHAFNPPDDAEED